MSHDRGCHCGRERWEYEDCKREGCTKGKNQIGDDAANAYASGRTKLTKSRTLNSPEPAPKKNDHPGIWTLVMADMAQRDIEGMKKYNTRLQGFNGRDALVDAYQEALDLAVYLRQAIYERDNK